MKKTVDLLVRVEVTEDLTPEEIADTVDTLINAGLIVDLTDALDMNIHSPKVFKPLLEGICETERGNTLLTSEDGNMVAWIDLGDNKRLQITFEPDNYPALSVGALSLTDEELAKHIRTKCGGWYARKLNVEGVELANGEVVGAPNYDDMTTDDEHRILSDIVDNSEVRDILTIGDVDAILREELNNDVVDKIADTRQTFDDAFEEIVREMIPAGIMNHDDVYSELQEHFNNSILEKWEEEQSNS